MTAVQEADWCRRLASEIEDPELKRALALLADDYERAATGAELSEAASFEPVSAPR